MICRSAASVRGRRVRTLEDLRQAIPISFTEGGKRGGRSAATARDGRQAERSREPCGPPFARRESFSNNPTTRARPRAARSGNARGGSPAERDSPPWLGGAELPAQPPPFRQIIAMIGAPLPR